MATGRAPRSSVIGKADMMTTSNSVGKPELRSSSIISFCSPVPVAHVGSLYQVVPANAFNQDKMTLGEF